jgi:beta-glucanase (GH16 family)
MSFKTSHGALVAWLLGGLALAAVAVGLLQWGATPPQARGPATPSAAIEIGKRRPMPVGDIPGWRQVFADNFTGRKLNFSKWHLYWGKPGGDPAGWFDPRHVTVSHGTLAISAYRDRADGGRWATGGLSSRPGLVQTYGKYLIRFRIGKGIGIGHAALLMPANNSWPPEVDFSEDNGSGRNNTLATLHYGSHDTHRDALLHVNLTQWHTLGVQWTPRKLRYTVDGRVWATMTGSAVPTVPMVLDLQTQTWPCSGTWGRCPNVTTPRVVRMYVDWVVAYAPASGAGRASGS